MPFFISIAILGPLSLATGIVLLVLRKKKKNIKLHHALFFVFFGAFCLILIAIFLYIASLAQFD